MMIRLIILHLIWRQYFLIASTILLQLLHALCVPFKPWFLHSPSFLLAFKSFGLLFLLFVIFVNQIIVVFLSKIFSDVLLVSSCSAHTLLVLSLLKIKDEENLLLDIVLCGLLILYNFLFQGLCPDL